MFYDIPKFVSDVDSLLETQLSQVDEWHQTQYVPEKGDQLLT